MTAPADQREPHTGSQESPVPRVVIHVPHASREIPADLRRTFLLDDAALDRELDRVTDHYTDELLAIAGTRMFGRAPVATTAGITRRLQQAFSSRSV